MNHRHLRSVLSTALTAAFACTTTHLPQGDPLTEATVSEAIEILRDSDGRIELLEGGLVVDLYIYEWRRVVRDDWQDPRGVRIGPGFGSDSHYERRLIGPKRDVYLPYASILAVQARSWPLWSGVELELDAEFQLRGRRSREAVLGRIGSDDPVVIRARDEQDAQQLSEAIDRVRRVHLPIVAPAPDAAPDSAPEAAHDEAPEADATADDEAPEPDAAAQ